MSESYPSAEFTFNQPSGTPLPPPAPKVDPLADALEMSFSKYATPGLMRPLFVIAMITVGLIYALQVVTSFIANPLLGFIAIVMGAVISIFTILAVRVGLEVALATVQSAIDVREMKNQQARPLV
jgi:Domain of unknown function (DUF4282)